VNEPPGQQWPAPQWPSHSGYHWQPSTIPPGVELANWGSRLASHLIDGLITTAVTFGAAIVVGFAVGGLTGDGDIGFGVGALIYFVALLAWMLSYFPLTMKRPGAHNGQTWGRQALSIRVLREDGQPVTAGTAYFRDVLMKYTVFLWGGACFLYVPTFLDVFWPLWDDRDQALHDKAADTFVVRA